MTASAAEALPPAATLTEAVSDEVRVLLARRRLRSSVLCGVLGMSSQAVSKKMRGLSSWSLEDLDALARFFGVDANALLPGLGKQGVGGANAGSVLPHLDSNQEPAGSSSPQVRRPFLSIVRGTTASQALTVRDVPLPRHERLTLTGAAS